MSQKRWGTKEILVGTHLWMSALEQIKYADSDPKIISDVFCTNYSLEEDYVSYIVERGGDHDRNGSDVFIPIFDNMNKKFKSELSGELSSEVIDEFMTPEYSLVFRKCWT
ncbi:hypothetical protein FLM48_18010 [Shewanella sp. Scap07]|nr:hypothetical protein FLM48_18010 [Shewanella sp. Scap07]